MTHRYLLRLHLLAFILLALATGCGPSRPAVVPVQGVVLLNGEPLPKAAIVFVPMIDGFSSEMNSVAMTDEQGRFTLKCNWKNTPGASVAKHKVLLYEAPPDDPSEAQIDLSDRSARRPVRDIPQNLSNRPIPKIYSNVATTTLEIEVTPGQTEYKIELKR